jgi:carboxylesterase type B
VPGDAGKSLRVGHRSGDAVDHVAAKSRGWPSGRVLPLDTISSSATVTIGMELAANGPAVIVTIAYRLGYHSARSSPDTAVMSRCADRPRSTSIRFRWTNADLIGRRLGTPDTLDVPFVFGTLPAYALTNLESPDPLSARMLSDAMQRAWLGFARDHQPSVAGVTCEPHNLSDRMTLIIGTSFAVERDLDARQRKAWGLPKVAAPA